MTCPKCGSHKVRITNQGLIAWKEKIDLPDLAPEPRRIAEKATFPPMPEDRIMRALQHAYDELESQLETTYTYIADDQTLAGVPWKQDAMRQLWKRKEIVMPLVAKHIQVEAREHNFNPPRNIFSIYLNADIAKIREHSK